MTAIPVFNLGKYLREHGLSAYALVKEVEGKVPASTVYGLARKPAQRIDLPIVYTLLDALERLRGEKVEIVEVIERQEDASATVAPSLTFDLPDNLPTYDLSSAKAFAYSGVRVQPRRVGPPAETIVAQLRGHE